MIRVFYDGKCGLCRREIHHYKQIAPQNVFEFVDITFNSASLVALNITIQDGLRLLHVQDRNGKICRGVDSFLLIWENIPRFRWLASIVRISPFYVIAAFLYDKFSAWHFTHMGYQKCTLEVGK
jgi:predicted DCC family thiol-disulfide oxidoreductase YuxK